MKNRRFPYGYEMKSGVIVVCPSEADILRQIFADYIGGAFLKTIADRLTAEKVEYLPGEYSWNKNRIKRIIEDGWRALADLGDLATISVVGTPGTFGIRLPRLSIF